MTGLNRKCHPFRSHEGMQQTLEKCFRFGIGKNAVPNALAIGDALAREDLIPPCVTQGRVNGGIRRELVPRRGVGIEDRSTDRCGEEVSHSRLSAGDASGDSKDGHGTERAAWRGAGQFHNTGVF